VKAQIWNAGPITFNYHLRGTGAALFAPDKGIFRWNEQFFERKAAGFTRRRAGTFEIRLDGNLVILYVLQVAAVSAVTLHLVRCRLQIRRRNRQSWNFLSARLDSRWNFAVLHEEETNATPAMLWTIYRNAQIMQQMADYIERNYQNADRKLIATLHRDATRIRFASLASLAQYAFRKPSVRA
jgi:hypothetical protein